MLYKTALVMAIDKYIISIGLPGPHLDWHCEPLCTYLSCLGSQSFQQFGNVVFGFGGHIIFFDLILSHVDFIIRCESLLKKLKEKIFKKKTE